MYVKKKLQPRIPFFSLQNFGIKGCNYPMPNNSIITQNALFHISTGTNRVS